jgi:hypothetical protein
VSPMSPLCQWLHRKFGWFSGPDLETEKRIIAKPAEDLEAALIAQRKRAERLGIVDGA